MCNLWGILLKNVWNKRQKQSTGCFRCSNIRKPTAFLIKSRFESRKLFWNFDNHKHCKFPNFWETPLSSDLQITPAVMTLPREYASKDRFISSIYIIFSIVRVIRRFLFSLRQLFPAADIKMTEWSLSETESDLAAARGRLIFHQLTLRAHLPHSYTHICQRLCTSSLRGSVGGGRGGRKREIKGRKRKNNNKVSCGFHYETLVRFGESVGWLWSDKNH